MSAGRGLPDRTFVEAVHRDHHPFTAAHGFENRGHVTLRRPSATDRGMLQTSRAGRRQCDDAVPFDPTNKPGVAVPGASRYGVGDGRNGKRRKRAGRA